MIWRKPLKTAFLLFGVLLLITGVVYPLFVAGVADLAFPHQAHGSLVRNESGAVMGSELIGLHFTGPRYFEGRPSSTQGATYNAAQSGGSNLGPSNPALLRDVNMTILHLKSLGITGPWPGDLVTSSASGLDPHITLDAALLQVPVVAKARGINEEDVRTLVIENIVSNPFLPHHEYVNVFSLNRALDRGGVP
ncbi:MAG: potassium-transporting ATPase subunit KdpC [Methanolinea sp.]|jgi:K+-transporting ATPase ATPase C chain|nr:potassium-transporting ATPase subunit KdpC [Methanolinea sp.]